MLDWLVAVYDDILDVEQPYDIHSLDKIHTVLYSQSTQPFYTYSTSQIPWTLEVRKEVSCICW